MLRRHETEQQHYPDRTGIRFGLERHCRQFRARKDAPRSCPAGLLAEVGLRWWRHDAARKRMEDLNVKVCDEAISGRIIRCDCCGSKALATTDCRSQE
jgi:hypothetical protein